MEGIILLTVEDHDLASRQANAAGQRGDLLQVFRTEMAEENIRGQEIHGVLRVVPAGSMVEAGSRVGLGSRTG
jgi:hypothetical protein